MDASTGFGGIYDSSNGKWLCGGKMGLEVVKAVHNDPELTLVGGIDPTKAGQDVGSVAGIEQLGITMNASIDEVLDTNKPDVIVDFTNPAVIYENAKKCYLQVFM